MVEPPMDWKEKRKASRSSTAKKDRPLTRQKSGFTARTPD